MQARSDDPGADALPDPEVIPAPRRRGPSWAALAVAMAIALQVSVPALALLLPPPQRFGFQMYSGIGGIGVTVVDRAGEEASFDDAPRLVGKLRPEVDWLLTLPEAVCGAVPEAVEVRVEQNDRERTVACD